MVQHSIGFGLGSGLGFRIRVRVKVAPLNLSAVRRRSDCPKLPRPNRRANARRDEAHVADMISPSAMRLELANLSAPYE